MLKFIAIQQQVHSEIPLTREQGNGSASQCWLHKGETLSSDSQANTQKSLLMGRTYRGSRINMLGSLAGVGEFLVHQETLL